MMKMGGVLRLCALLAVFGGSLVARAQNTVLRNIEIDADGDVDIPRVLDLFALKEGDVLTEGALEQALVRIAQGGGRFQGLKASFDPSTGIAKLTLRLGNRIQGVDLRVGAGPGALGEVPPEELAPDLLQILGVTRGDIVTPESVGELRARLTSRLKDRGYPDPRVVLALEERPGVLGRVLFVSVETGPRAIIKRVRLKGFRAADVDEFFSFLRTGNDLTQIMGVFLDSARKVLGAGARSGSDAVSDVPVTMPLDWIVLSDAANQWAQRARADGYFDFRTSLEVEEDVDGKLILGMTLERGLRYDIQFKGNIAFWERDLREKVTDRPVRLGVPFALADAETVVRRLYAAEGAKDVRIESLVSEDKGIRRVLFRITEGPFYFVRDFYFDRGADAERVLALRILREWREANQDPFRQIPFDDRLLKSWIPDLVRRFRSEGFLQARVLEMRPTFREGSRVVDVEIAIQLGLRSKVRDVAVVGNIALTEAELDKLIDVEVGAWANPDRILESSRRLQQAYLDLGFFNARVVLEEERSLKFSSDGLSVDVEILVDPGPQVGVGRPLVSGLTKTKERVVIRELDDRTLGTGQLWTPGRQRRLEETLLGLGIFGSAQVEASGGRRLSGGRGTEGSVEVQEKDVRISVAERPGGSIEFGPGFRTDLGLVAFAEYSYRNLGGWNRGIATRAQVSRKLEDYQFPEQKYSLVYLEPFLLNRRLKLRAAAEYLREDDVNFEGGVPISGINREEVTLGFTLERELFDRILWTHNLYTISLPEIEAFDEESASRREDYRIGSIGTGLTFDFRDNIFNPMRGYYASTSFEYAAPALGSDRDANFLLFRNSVTFYFPAYRRSSFALHGAYHWMTGLGDSEGLPENRRLTLGGRNSVRSLPENFLRFDDAGVLRMQAFEVKLEFRQPILLDLGLAFFVDGGQVDILRMLPSAEAPSELSTGFRKGVGVGLRYATAVGPLALDLAYNLDRRDNEGDIKFQFAIGSF